MKKALFIGIGTVFMINATCMVAFSNLHIGLLGLFLLGCVFLLFGTFWKRVQKWLKILFVVCACLLLISISTLLLYGHFDNVDYQESAVVVLGSGIRGEQLTVGLKNRLDAAIQYYEKNPSAVIVVSGGQGPQETITEASAMERYLVEQGIPQEKIIKEEQATSTYENFLYTKGLLDAYFHGPYTIAYITNNYHIYRAGAIAKNAGFEEVTHCSGATPWYSIFPSCVRECIGVLKFWILGK